jgi:hypothetical protein
MDPSTILMLLGIAGVIVGGLQGWHPVHPKKKGDSKGTRKEHILIVVSALVTISVLLLNGSSWIAKHLAKKQAVICQLHMQKSDTIMPDCVVWGISVVPTGNIKAFHMIVQFTKPIHDSRLVIHTFTHANNNPGFMGRTKINEPCEIAVDKPADRDDSLTFTVSTDRQEIIINGRDLSYYNSQTFLVTFYPDPGYRKSAEDINVSGQASYEAFGHEVQADINMIDDRDASSKTLVQ